MPKTKAAHGKRAYNLRKSETVSEVQRRTDLDKRSAQAHLAHKARKPNLFMDMEGDLKRAVKADPVPGPGTRPGCAVDYNPHIRIPSPKEGTDALRDSTRKPPLADRDGSEDIEDDPFMDEAIDDLLTLAIKLEKYPDEFAPEKIAQELRTIVETLQHVKVKGE